MTSFYEALTLMAAQKKKERKKPKENLRLIVNFVRF